MKYSYSVKQEELQGKLYPAHIYVVSDPGRQAHKIMNRNQFITFVYKGTIFSLILER